MNRTVKIQSRPETKTQLNIFSPLKQQSKKKQTLNI